VGDRQQNLGRWKKERLGARQSRKQSAGTHWRPQGRRSFSRTLSRGAVGFSQESGSYAQAQRGKSLIEGQLGAELSIRCANRTLLEDGLFQIAMMDDAYDGFVVESTP